MSTEQVTDLEKMKDPDEERFHFNDLELLETGQFFDAQVMANGRVWQVHKSIVCPRSGFMRQLFHSNNGIPVPKKLPFTTERQAAMLLEYIYSGGIKDIDELSLEECVNLSVLGEKFKVDGMVDYGTNKLASKLKSNLQPTPDSRNVISFKERTEVIHQGHSRGFRFGVQLTLAVYRAYSHEGNACQLVFADFVWATRSWIIGTPLLERLNVANPGFASRILTTFNKGPQTSFFQAGSQILELQLHERESESPEPFPCPP